ncbi:MAG: type VI secretion system ATPase TssH [bacterium]
MISVEIKLLLERLNTHCKRSFEAAAGLCVERQHYEVTIEHVLLKMLDEPGCDVHDILRHYGIDASRVQKKLVHHLEALRSGNAGRPTFSALLLEWAQEGWLLASVEMNAPRVRSAALLRAIINRPDRFTTGDWAEILEPISKEDVRKNAVSICTGSVEDESPASAPGGAGGPAAAAGAAGKPGGDSALARFCTNFTQKAREGGLDPVFGRDREIRQMVDILARRRKNNPIVVGEAGVGKTAVVEGLAIMIVSGDVPDVLHNVELLGLDLGLLQAGASVKGEFENRLKGVIEETKSSPKPIILFIDEAHTLIGAGGAAGGGDAANLLKPALARGELRTIAATTWSEYKKYFEKDPALARRFQPVKLDEPSEETAVVILRGLRDMYEKSHGVRILDSAVVAAARLSTRYISGRQLPDKAVDLLDTASARVKIGLSSKPGAIEDLERTIQMLERESRARARDSQAGVPGDAKADAEVAQKIADTKEELVVRDAAWRVERDAARKVVELRDRIEGKPAAKAAAQPAKSDAKSDAKGGADGGAKDDAKSDAKAEAKAGAGAAKAAAVEEPKPLTEAERAALTVELETASAALRAAQGKTPLIHVEVNPEVVSQVVADWTGIPVGNMVRDEAASILAFDDKLKKRIKGQDHAVDAIAQGLRASKAGMGNPRAPMGVFLFVGPSGVGKTETALGVADLLFGGERFMTIINMSEFQEKHTVSRLIGSPPGYVGYGEGGVLTEAVRQRPYSVVLLDECEKADPEVMNLFYQVFDKGMLSDGEGRLIDFKNTVIFMTSNLASDTIMQMGSGPVRPEPDELVSAIRPTLNKHFKPALVARMTLVPFYPISGDAMKEIVSLKVNQVGSRLMASHRMGFDLDPAVIDLISARCTEVETGARNIDHILSGTLLPMISTQLLQRMSEGPLPDKLGVTIDGSGGFRITFPEGS